MLQSVSRLIGEVVAPQVRAAGQAIRQLLAAYRETQDLIAIGAYQRGTDPIVDAAIDLRPRVERFLRPPLGTAGLASPLASPAIPGLSLPR